MQECRKSLEKLLNIKNRCLPLKNIHNNITQKMMLHILFHEIIPPCCHAARRTDEAVMYVCEPPFIQHLRILFVYILCASTEMIRFS